MCFAPRKVSVPQNGCNVPLGSKLPQYHSIVALKLRTRLSVTAERPRGAAVLIYAKRRTRWTSHALSALDLNAQSRAKRYNISE